MKSILIYAAGLIWITMIAIASCTSTNSETIPEINYQTIIEEDTLLLGVVDRTGFELPHYTHWFDSTYQAYVPQDSTLERIGSMMQDVQVKVFMATWCSDSRRDVPALYKILDNLAYDTGNLRMIAVDRTKTKPTTETKGFDIEFVPTMIFYRQEKELGRIIEFPNLTLEEDILNIVTTSG